MELIKDKEYPAKTEVTKVIEGGETIEFRSLFKQWSAVKGFSAGEKQARLFNLTKKGKFAQIINFEKHDLEEDNVMILGKNFPLCIIYITVLIVITRFIRRGRETICLVGKPIARKVGRRK